MNTLKRLSLIFVMLALLLPAAMTGADDDAPTLAILSFGLSPAYDLTQTAIFDSLEVYGFLTSEERETLAPGSDLHGENINILFRDAGFDFPTASLMVEDALDQGADALLTLSNEVGMIAAGALDDMDDPPALFFAIVTAPYHLGLGQSSCVKPDYITGTAMYVDWSNHVPAYALQDPDLDYFGMIADAADPTAQYFLAAIAQFAAAEGWSYEVANFSSVTELGPATQSLVDKGVQAIGLLPSTASSAGLPAVIEAAVETPVYSMLISDVHIGATIGMGFDGWYREGVTAASMVAAYLNGELDPATTMVNTTKSYVQAVNLDSAEMQGVEIAPALLDAADFVIKDGEAIGVAVEIPGVGSTLPLMTPAERMAADAELLASLECTEEIIAEQLAALEALR